MSYKRARIIKREENKVKREEKMLAAAAAKAKTQADKIEIKKKTKGQRRYTLMNCVRLCGHER